MGGVCHQSYTPGEVLVLLKPPPRLSTKHPVINIGERPIVATTLMQSRIRDSDWMIAHEQVVVHRLSGIARGSPGV